MTDQSSTNAIPPASADAGERIAIANGWTRYRAGEVWYICHPLYGALYAINVRHREPEFEELMNVLSPTVTADADVAGLIREFRVSSEAATYAADDSSVREEEFAALMGDRKVAEDALLSAFTSLKVRNADLERRAEAAEARVRELERLLAVPDNLRAMSENATPGPWYTDTVEVEGSYSGGGNRWTSYIIRSETEKYYGNDAAVLDAQNSEVTVISEDHDEDGVHAWDEPSRANTKYVAALVNWHRAQIRATTPDQES